MHTSNGFTLVEMAVVLVIIGLLLGGLLMPLSNQIENRRRQATLEQLAEVEDALIGFAISNRRMPCPDRNGDGFEDGPPCNNVEGNLPWATLGVGRFDAWQRPFRYRAENNFTAAPIPDPAATAGGLRVNDRAGTRLTAADPDGPAAVVFSCGPDGIPNAANDANGRPNRSADCSNPGRPDPRYTEDVPVAGQFDDLLVWVSKNKLISRLAEAGKWP